MSQNFNGCSQCSPHRGVVQSPHSLQRSPVQWKISMNSQTIPYDIWDYIVNIIAEIPNPQNRPKGRLRQLTMCAVVCKDFSKFCRPRIFEHISGIVAIFKPDEFVNWVRFNPALGKYRLTLTIIWLPGRVSSRYSHRWLTTMSFPKSICRYISTRCLTRDIHSLRQSPGTPLRDSISTH